MYSATVILTQTDPASTTPPASLASQIVTYRTLVGMANSTKKLSNILWFSVYAESGNDEDVTTGFARIGFDIYTGRAIVAPATKPHGIPLFGGLEPRLFISSGASGVYDFNNTFIVGKAGDTFQITWGVL